MVSKEEEKEKKKIPTPTQLSPVRGKRDIFSGGKEGEGEPQACPPHTKS